LGIDLKSTIRGDIELNHPALRQSDIAV